MCRRWTLANLKKKFTDRLSRQFAAKLLLKFPTHLQGVTTLLCEISIFQKSAPNETQQPQTDLKKPELVL